MSLKVDLKSQEQRRSIGFDFGWILVVAALLISFVVFYFCGVRLDNKIAAQKKELQMWKDKVAGFSGIQGKLDALKVEISGLQAQITRMRELRFDPLRYSLLLSRLSRLFPANLWVASLSIDPSSNSMTMTGFALGQPGKPPLASVAELLRNLQNDKDNTFSNIVLQGTSATGKTGDLWNFNLQANYNVTLIASPPSLVPAPPGALPALKLQTPGMTTPMPAQSAPAPAPAVSAPAQSAPGNPQGGEKP